MEQLSYDWLDTVKIKADGLKTDGIDFGLLRHLDK